MCPLKMLVQNTIDSLRGLVLQTITITGEFSPDWSWRSWGLVPQTGLAGLACCPHLKRKNLFIILSHIILPSDSDPLDGTKSEMFIFLSFMFANFVARKPDQTRMFTQD